MNNTLSHEEREALKQEIFHSLQDSQHSAGGKTRLGTVSCSD